MSLFVFSQWLSKVKYLGGNGNRVLLLQLWFFQQSLKRTFLFEWMSRLLYSLVMFLGKYFLVSFQEHSLINSGMIGRLLVNYLLDKLVLYVNLYWLLLINFLIFLVKLVTSCHMKQIFKPLFCLNIGRYVLHNYQGILDHSFGPHVLYVLHIENLLS